MAACLERALSAPLIDFSINDGVVPPHINRAIQVLTDEVVALNTMPIYPRISRLTVQAYFIEQCIRRKIEELFPDKDWELKITYACENLRIPGTEHQGKISVIRLKKGEPFSDGDIYRTLKQRIDRLRDPMVFKDILLTNERIRTEADCVLITVIFLLLIVGVAGAALYSPGIPDSTG